MIIELSTSEVFVQSWVLFPFSSFNDRAFFSSFLSPSPHSLHPMLDEVVFTLFCFVLFSGGPFLLSPGLH